MKEQKLITDNALTFWEITVNRYIKEDWHVVPGTLSITVAVATSENYNNQIERAFAVVIEKN
jgi:hypothetical protein